MSKKYHLTYFTAGMLTGGFIFDYMEPKTNLPNYDSVAVSTKPFFFDKNLQYLVLVSDDGDSQTNGDEQIKALSREAGFDGEHFHVELCIDGRFYSGRYGMRAESLSFDEINTCFKGAEYVVKRINVPDLESAVSLFHQKYRGTEYDVQLNNCTHVVSEMLIAGGVVWDQKPVNMNDFKRNNPFVIRELRKHNFEFKVDELYFPDQFDAIGEFVEKGKLGRDYVVLQ